MSDGAEESAERAPGPQLKNRMGLEPNDGVHIVDPTHGPGNLTSQGMQTLSYTLLEQWIILICLNILKTDLLRLLKIKK